ncbi:MAG: hypothetical protein ACLSVD_03735 [Eggerthellaceae bacterium]
MTKNASYAEMREYALMERLRSEASMVGANGPPSSSTRTSGSDYFLPDRAGGKEAIDLIVFAFEYEFPLLYPAAIVKDVFYVAVSTFKRIARAEKGSLTQSDAVTATETAWGCVNSMRKQATAVGADASDL